SGKPSLVVSRWLFVRSIKHIVLVNKYRVPNRRLSLCTNAGPRGTGVSSTGSSLSNSLAPWYWHGRRPARHLSLIEYRVCSNMCRHGGQHLLFAVNQIAGTEGRDFKPVAVRDGVRRAGLDAISTEDTSIIVDVINLGVALSAAHAMLSGVLRRFDIYAIGG